MKPEQNRPAALLVNANRAKGFGVNPMPKNNPFPKTNPAIHKLQKRFGMSASTARLVCELSVFGRMEQ